jgi:polyisoprenoid-binding protein YceI
MATYKIDPVHSEILFKVRHMMISNVAGTFGKFDAKMESNTSDFSDAKVTFVAETSSVNTNNAQRDGHLQSPDFFNSAKYPEMTFASTSLEKKSSEEYKLNGNLTIRDVTRPVSLKVNYGGTQTDSYGQKKSGFEIEGTINRKDFGLVWNMPIEAGGVVVSEEVKLQINIQMVLQKAQK